VNLTLAVRHRKLAERLIRATVKDGADATTALLRHFPPDTWPALIAYLARVATEKRSTGCCDGRHQYVPVLLTEHERLLAHRAYRNGSRAPEVVMGEREYQRYWARQRRQRKTP